jgi:hypothetical protein
MLILHLKLLAIVSLVVLGVVGIKLLLEHHQRQQLSLRGARLSFRDTAEKIVGRKIDWF